jgi:diaminohydroxyphosphoribosylaminopyrimidine deaminase / 5-amino-6-(5-phosphoribosylamino)uracil reductase
MPDASATTALATTAAATALAPILAAPRGQSFVVAQLGQSLDGRIALPSGESRWINQSAALDHVHRLRAAVDGVVVGVGTAVADDPLLNVRRVPGRNPARIVIDPKGRLPLGRRCFERSDGVRLIVVRAAPGPCDPGVEELIVRGHDGTCDPREIVRALARVGIEKLLIEGGAWTVSGFISAGAVHRLHVLMAPMILGSGKTGLNLTGISRLADAPRPPTTTTVLPDGDVLFDCDLGAPGLATTPLSSIRPHHHSPDAPPPPKSPPPPE